MQNIVYIDTDCLLCSRIARFIARNDRKGNFSFSSVNSDSFTNLANKFPVIRDRNSVVLLSEGKVYYQSGAVLALMQRLRFPWPVFSVFYIVPAFLRNRIYGIIARNRYKWFGYQNNCAMASQSVRARIID